ncbi:hypothetical protein A9Q87_05625 [Flavobacteriales bacterium 34_180_T64]|nr:hypothetical protein A9Q87_05625 [Flavobacteriales bacterium 34_180_T64]
MTSFIKDVIVDLQNKEQDFSQLIFVLPSKRAGVFLKQAVSENLKKTIFAPEILSIEEFIESLSDVQYATNTELLFEFYQVYLSNTPKDQQDGFDTFSKWAQILIQDFNEIDRYLIPPNSIFEYLSAIKHIESNHWSLEENQTQYVKNYLLFWNRIKTYYTFFKAQLLSKRKGYQGLVYREAVENIEQYTSSFNPNKTHVFVGFNALNKAEETIIQELLQQDLALIYWDIDSAFIDNPIHDAGLFTRTHKAKWTYYKNNPFNWINTHYAHKKNIDIIGTPKNIGQTKYIGEILGDLQQKNKTLKSTAVILSDESLLLPLLNSLPEQIDAINITMGLPLNIIPLTSLFESLFHIHKTTTPSLYYKDVKEVLSHQFILPLLKTEESEYSNIIIDHIQNHNLVYLNLDKLKELAKEKSVIIDLLFGSWENKPLKAIKICIQLILRIKEHLDLEKAKNLLALEYLYRFNEVFNELYNLNQTYEHIQTIQTLYGLYKELLKSETLDFKGEPLEGLQVMGMLESRVLDFETVIISSVNEGILPAGKSNNSFIPFDVKIENQLPTYKEKDAVYTYHFYRLLQRAKNVYILYNTEPDVLNGGEKSRFISQMEIEKVHSLNKYIIAPVVPLITRKMKSISKTADVLDRLESISKNGFSPSSLTNYIRNPIDFYNQKILKLKDLDTVEETIAANTLGTIVHNSLEDLYKPFEGEFLSEKIINGMMSQIDKLVRKHFKSEYKDGEISKGKNLIIFEIAKRYVSNFLNYEITEIKKGNQIKLIAVEIENKVSIEIPELDFPVFLTGKVDRVDEFNGTTRIIDYKTGRVEQSKVEIVNWEDLTTDYEQYSKSFQILTYAYTMKLNNQISLPIVAGIISFKNLSKGVLTFAKKDRAGAYAKKETAIAHETLDTFELELKKLILEICNPEIPFVEKEIK